MSTDVSKVPPIVAESKTYVVYLHTLPQLGNLRSRITKLKSFKSDKYCTTHSNRKVECSQIPQRYDNRERIETKTIKRVVHPHTAPPKPKRFHRQEPVRGKVVILSKDYEYLNRLADQKPSHL